MRWVTSLLFLFCVCGCSQQQNASLNVVPSTSVPGDLSGSNSFAATEYPEKTDVERLLSRAVEFEANGKFHEALAIVNEALVVDANSPRASTFKQRLEEIIRRI